MGHEPATATAPMPVFTIKAQDALAIDAVTAYRDLCTMSKLDGQASEVQLAINEIELWQQDHEDQLRLPDHRHVPVDAGRQREMVLEEVIDERARQDAKWGEQNHPDGTGRPGSRELADWARARCQANGPGEDNWQDILTEEMYEAFAETDPMLLRAELVQTAAVIVQWIQAIDRRVARAGLTEVAQP